MEEECRSQQFQQKKKLSNYMKQKDMDQLKIKSKWRSAITSHKANHCVREANDCIRTKVSDATKQGKRVLLWIDDKIKFNIVSLKKKR